MTDRDTGGPAFARPMSQQTNAGGEVITFDNGDPGMTLRDYFAGQALAGMTVPDDVKYSRIYRDADRLKEDEAQLWAAFAYRVADAMLKERSK